MDYAMLFLAVFVLAASISIAAALLAKGKERKKRWIAAFLFGILASVPFSMVHTVWDGIIILAISALGVFWNLCALRVAKLRERRQCNP